jgi:hypothetical protein
MYEYAGTNYINVQECVWNDAGLTNWKICLVATFEYYSIKLISRFSHISVIWNLTKIFRQPANLHFKMVTLNIHDF